MRLRKTDLWWLLAYPIYQVIGTTRHEGSHALMALLQGVRITKVQLLPSLLPDGRFFWGYVLWTGGHPTWLTDAAPYFCDVLTFPIFAWVCHRARGMPHWLWVNVFVLGMVSPLANMAYNYSKVFRGAGGDVNELLRVLPHWAVHTAFLAAMGLMGAWTWAKVLRKGSPIDPGSPP